MEVLGINLLYGVVNRVRPSDVPQNYRVSFGSWRANVERGFSWDNDPFIINQIGHPYQGGNYFTAGRSLGLSYWESLPLTVLGSLTWELLGETTRPAWNDVANTTLGGAALGEVLHRMAWLIRDPGRTGSSRRWREVVALGLDPITGLNRLALGDASRVAPKPVAMQPPRFSGEAASGTLWRGVTGDLDSARAEAFGAFVLRYGDLDTGPATTPFDAFTISLRAGGGAVLSDASIRGRLTARPLTTDVNAAHHLLLVQGFDYQATSSFLFSGQSLLGGVADRFRVSPGLTVSSTALAGVVALGAVDSLWPAKETRPFDYGSGLMFSSGASLMHRGRTVAGVSFKSSYLRTVTRAPASHLFSVLRAEVRLPIRSGVSLGMEGERGARTTRAAALPVERRTYPQIRTFLAWEFSQ